ncbi:MAG: hypothetical protein CL930_06310 [Deltaproteobacteria bacterium]|nr:hypothetical protein [Deltaproteobacteria bacterium]|tara:strand:+ start:574 stop:1044 length:471 start_codon:yes stop_codon:yes gene_type:complete
MNRILSCWVLLLLAAVQARTYASPVSASVIVEVLHPKSELTRLPAGSTVDDALKAVGLPTRGNSTVLANGDCLHVTKTSIMVTASERALAMGERLTLNSATAAALDTVPGIGPVRAAAIVGFRNENGPFENIKDLDDVHGIGPATIKKVAPFVRAL